jgi:hypothetical protein
MQAILGIALIYRLRAAAALSFFLVWPGLLILAGPAPGDTAGWSATGSMDTGRSFHTATLLPNGKVLVAGGRYSLYYHLNSSELYDPAAKTWSSTGSMATPRAFHTATLLPNSQVLVAGGVDVASNWLSSAELYDPVNGTWSATGSMATGREFHTATLLGNSLVLVAGGYSPQGVLLNSAELYREGAILPPLGLLLMGN